MSGSFLDASGPLPIDRDDLGRIVREAWVRWAEGQPHPKSSWLEPYDALAEHDKEADRQIGEAVALATTLAIAAANGSPVGDGDRHEWVAANRRPDKPGWFWVWDGFPNHDAAVARINCDELGNWSWAVGQWFGEYESMSRRFPWRWSHPILRTGRGAG